VKKGERVLCARPVKTKGVSLFPALEGVKETEQKKDRKRVSEYTVRKRGGLGGPCGGTRGDALFGHNWNGEFSGGTQRS